MMATGKFAEYDAELIRLISNGCTTFTSLSPRMYKQSVLIQPEDCWRVTDRRLQALRKKGEIEFIRSNWAIKVKSK